MKIWKIDSDSENSVGFGFYNYPEDYKNATEILYDGNKTEKWDKYELECFDTNMYVEDGLHLTYTPINMLVTKKWADKILSRYGDYVEALPLYYKDKNETYYILKVLNIIDALDYEKSEFRVVRNRKVDINKCVFNDRINNIPIFQTFIDNRVYKYEIFVNDEFKDFIEVNNIRGFNFEEVYESSEIYERNLDGLKIVCEDDEADEVRKPLLRVTGVLIDKDNKNFGYIVKEKRNLILYSRETIIEKFKTHDFENCYLRRMMIDGKLHTFVDLDLEPDEEGAIYITYEKDELDKIYK